MIRCGLATGHCSMKAIDLNLVFVTKKEIIIQAQDVIDAKALLKKNHLKGGASGIIKRSKNILQVVASSMKGGAYMVVIKCNLYTNEEGRKNLQKTLLKEAIEGLIVLPSYCDLVGVSEDNEIEVDYEGFEDIEC